MSRPLIDALNKLIVANSMLPSSQFSPKQQQALNSFSQQTNAISQRPQGRGTVYQVINLPRVELELKTLQPINAENLANDLPQRSINIGLYRNSKAKQHNHDVSYILMKAISPSVIWQKENGHYLDVSENTRLSGVASLMITASDNWCSQQPLRLVENQALFDNLSWLPDDATGTIVYYAGQLHGVLLNWLAQKPRCREVILFPDYDGVGLSNYVRLYEKLDQKVKLWLMPNWQNKLRQMGSRELWIKNRSLFDASLSKMKAFDVDDELWLLNEKMRQYGLVLEQETIFMNIED